MLGMIVVSGKKQMYLKGVVICFGLWISGFGSVLGQSMDNARLFEILDSVTDSLEGTSGFWQLEYNDRMMLVITDERFDRMRIISPIKPAEELTETELIQAMAANFHSALDARYAISEDILWSAFIHPLRALSEEQVRDALTQVFRAAETFGTTFSSTELVFPGSGGESGSRRGKRSKM